MIAAAPIANVNTLPPTLAAKLPAPESAGFSELMEQGSAQPDLEPEAEIGTQAPVFAGKLPAGMGLGWLARIGLELDRDAKPGQLAISNVRGSLTRSGQDPERDDEVGALSMLTPAMPPIAPPLPPPLPMPFPARFPTPKPAPAETEPLKMMPPQEPGQPKVEVLAKAEPVKGASAFQIQMKAPAEEKPKRQAMPAPMPSRLAMDMAQPPVLSHPAPTAPQTEAPADPAPVQPVTETRRVDAVENAAPPTPPAHHIALRVKADDDRSVDIRLVSRAGEVHVSVHTPDPALARTMRTELGSLTGKLAEAGFGVHGVAAGPGETSSTTTDRQDSRRENSDSHHQQQQREQQDAQQQQQQGRGRRRAPFLFDLELN